MRILFIIFLLIQVSFSYAQSTNAVKYDYHLIINEIAKSLPNEPPGEKLKLYRILGISHEGYSELLKIGFLQALHIQEDEYLLLGKKKGLVTLPFYQSLNLFEQKKYDAALAHLSKLKLPAPYDRWVKIWKEACNVALGTQQTISDNSIEAVHASMRLKAHGFKVSPKTLVEKEPVLARSKWQWIYLTKGYQALLNYDFTMPEKIEILKDSQVSYFDPVLMVLYAEAHLQAALQAYTNAVELAGSNDIQHVGLLADLAKASLGDWNSVCGSSSNYSLPTGRALIGTCYYLAGNYVSADKEWLVVENGDDIIAHSVLAKFWLSLNYPKEKILKLCIFHQKASHVYIRNILSVLIQLGEWKKAKTILDQYIKPADKDNLERMDPAIILANSLVIYHENKLGYGAEVLGSLSILTQHFPLFQAVHLAMQVIQSDRSGQRGTTVPGY